MPLTADDINLAVSHISETKRKHRDKDRESKGDEERPKKHKKEKREKKISSKVYESSLPKPFQMHISVGLNALEDLGEYNSIMKDNT
jgi:hypothetical protein